MGYTIVNYMNMNLLGERKIKTFARNMLTKRKALLIHSKNNKYTHTIILFIIILFDIIYRNWWVSNTTDMHFRQTNMTDFQMDIKGVHHDVNTSRSTPTLQLIHLIGCLTTCHSQDWWKRGTPMQSIIILSLINLNQKVS